MKRVGFLYEKVYNRDNIRYAIQCASKGKKKKPMVKWVMANELLVVETIHKILKEKTYTPSPYFKSVIKDGLSKKERIIYKPKFYPDQIIHWCLMLVLKDALMRGMYKWNCASIPNRGIHYAKRACEKWIRHDKKKTKYVLKIDIKKYYPSINKDILKNKFRRILKDNHILWLIDSIIDSHDKGLPIGNYTSQWFANFYLQDLDHYIVEQLQVKHMIRYMDDIVIFHSNKRKLKKIFEDIKVKVEEEGLEIKGNWQIFNLEYRNLDFCGFVYLRDKTFIRKRITRNMRRTWYRFNKSHTQKKARRMLSYYGWVKHSNSYVLYKKYFNLKLLKEMSK